MESNLKKALGIDIGGTKISFAIVNQQGEILNKVSKISTPKNIDEIKIELQNIINKYEKKVDVIGIATAGTVSLDNREVTGSTGNLPVGYSSIDFQSLSESKPIFLENDANAASWAEFKLGNALNMNNSITLTIGTGVGSGIIINGNLLKGKDGKGAEMHFKINRGNKRRCTCGSFDCFEIYASGNGLKLTAEEIFDDKNISTYDIIELMVKNDQKALKAFKIWHNDILSGLISLANIFDPEAIVISGSMSKFLNYKFLQSSLNKYSISSGVKVLRAKFLNDSGIIGSAILALNNLDNN